MTNQFRKITIVALLFLAIIASSACNLAEEYRQRHEEKTQTLSRMGLIGQHTIKKTNHLVSLQGAISGGFFFGSGSISGSVTTEPALIFYWEASPGVEYATTLPYRMFQFITDETKDIPTVEFNLDRTTYALSGNSSMAIEESNPNTYLTTAYLNLVTVRISTATKQKEIYLPH
jgi:hypothetical protein